MANIDQSSSSLILPNLFLNRLVIKMILCCGHVSLENITVKEVMLTGQSESNLHLEQHFCGAIKYSLVLILMVLAMREVLQ